MSLYKDASLAMIPSAYKDGKLYSIRPTDGSGDFTFSRGSNLAATRVDVNGLIEKGRENLLLQSNSFSTSPWNTNLVTATSGQSGYNGNNNAWKIDLTGAAGNLAVGGLSVGSVGTYSVYAKAGTLNWILLGSQSGNIQAYINLSDGSIGTTGAKIIEAKTEDVGGGWYRCSMTYSGTATVVRVYPAQANGNLTATSGNIYIQDTQLEQGLVATDYIETGASTAQAGILEDMPRLDYSGSCPSLLLEPQRSNLFEHSEYFGGIPYQTRVIITDNSIVSPEGLRNAAKLVATTDNGSHGVDYIPNVIATSYSMSVYAKAGETSKFVLLTNNRGSNAARGFDVSNGTTFASDLGGYSEPTSYSIEAVGNDWYYCIIQFEKTSSGGSGNGITLTNDSGQHSFVGNGTDGMYFYGWQMEQGSYPTSYIPTYGSSVTRSGDSCVATSVSDLIGQTQGTLFVEVKANFDFQGGRLLLIGQANNFIELVLRTTGKINAFVWNGTPQVDFNSSSTYSTGDTLKIALAYRENDFILYINGVQEGSDTSGVIPNAMSQIIINNYTAPNFNSANAYKQALIFPTRLTNAELAALTA